MVLDGLSWGFLALGDNKPILAILHFSFFMEGNESPTG